MDYCNPNHPFVVWASCFLWLMSMFAIAWSLLLFFCIADMLYISGTDLVNAVVLLSGIIMMPTNVHMLCNIAYGKKINHKTKVVCCPLWLCIVWIIAINCLGVLLCIYKIFTCEDMTQFCIVSTLKHYRSVPKYKHFIDNVQWSLKCCGFKSYKDWFDYDWYDRIRDYEWDPSQNKRHAHNNEAINTVSDSVPLSCCKSGSCISNYLIELGTGSINTQGCGEIMYHIILYSMIIHLGMFMSVIIVEALIFKLISSEDLPLPKLTKIPATTDHFKSKDKIRSSSKSSKSRRTLGTLAHVRHIMAVKDNYSASSASVQLNPDESDEFDRAEQLSLVPRHIRHARMETCKDLKKIDDECPESPKELARWSNH